MSEIDKLKYWLDGEISINHAYYWVILGVLIGGKFWFIAGAGIVLSLGYALRRVALIAGTDRDYLKVQKGVK